MSVATARKTYEAEAFYGLGWIDMSATTAEEALTLARSARFNKQIARVRNLYTAMTQSRWRNESYVAELGVLLATQ